MSDSGKADANLSPSETVRNELSGGDNPTPGIGRGRGTRRGRGRGAALQPESRPRTRSSSKNKKNQDEPEAQLASPNSSKAGSGRVVIPANDVFNSSSENLSAPSRSESPDPPPTAQEYRFGDVPPQQGLLDGPRLLVPPENERNQGVSRSDPEIRNANANPRVPTDTPAILLGMKNRQQAFQSRIEEQAMRLSRIERLSAQIEKIQLNQGNVLNSHANRLDVVENDVRYVSAQAAEVKSQTRELSQSVAHHSECIDNLTGLIEGCNSLITKGSDSRQKLRDDLEKTQKELKDIARKASSGSCGRPSIYPKVKLDLPTFNAAPYERPGRFMDDLTNYMLALNCDEETMKLAIGQALKGPAREWWYYIESSVFSLDDFRTRFMEKYWNPREQDKVRRALEFGSYAAERNLSRAEYATKLYNQVVQLPDNYSPELIVEKMSNHFDETIQQAVLIKNCADFDDFLKLLEKLDSAKVLNSTLENTKYVDFRGDGHYVRNQPQTRGNDSRFSRGGFSANQKPFGPSRSGSFNDLSKISPSQQNSADRGPYRASTPYPDANRTLSQPNQNSSVPRQVLSRDRPYINRDNSAPNTPPGRNDDKRRSVNEIDIEETSDHEEIEQAVNSSPLH
ncbi:hypothetical protein QAD02_006116 [Eretmocerus hayati]|uniref:Uncharacterized protein n=1 Tax=Eretmocerus hayati TaxID=131215 RepID=A0ACC2N0D3_9HYME|nr:hypothetical protein QAD02_006116 [Eretmocerus hayati]